MNRITIQVYVVSSWDKTVHKEERGNHEREQHIISSESGMSSAH